MQGQTQGQKTTKAQTAQEKMDKEKSALRDKVKKELDDAQANIDGLQNDLQNKTGAERIRDERLLKDALRYRDDLNVDLMTIDHASTKDWSAIRATVNGDMNQFKGVVRRVAIARKAPKPRQGSTNVQPQGGSSDTNK